jgi:hypothetical protein
MNIAIKPSMIREENRKLLFDVAVEPGRKPKPAAKDCVMRAAPTFNGGFPVFIGGMVAFPRVRNLYQFAIGNSTLITALSRDKTFDQPRGRAEW